MPILPAYIDTSRFSDYDKMRWEEIHEWLNPPKSFAQDLSGFFGRQLDSLTEMAKAIPGVEWTIDHVIAGMLQLVNEMSHDWVWSERIYRDARTAGLEIEKPGDAFRYPLEKIDELCTGVSPKYRSLATASGAATGYAGAAGIVPDIVALVAINLKATGEYATHYGYDIEDEGERLFALQVLNVASGERELVNNLASKPVERVSAGLAKKQGIEALSQSSLAYSVKKAVEKLGIQLTRAKLAQLMPVAGAAIGGSFNLYYSGKTLECAQLMYRKRFLIDHYALKRANPT